MHTRHIDTLAVGNPAAALDCGVDLPLVGDIIHRQFDQAVVDQHPAARTQIPAQSAIGDVGAFLCTRHLFRCQDKVRARLQHDCTVFKHTQPDLRALGVQHVPMGRPSSSRRRTTIRNFSRCSSWVPWEKLNRATSIPASIIRRRVASSELDGPSVQIIFCLAHQAIHHTFLYAAVAVLFSLYRSSLEIATENAPGLQNPQSFYKVPFPAHFTASFRSLFGPRGFLTPSPLTNAPGCIMLTVLAILVH